MVSRRIRQYKEFLSESDYMSPSEIGGTHSAEVFMKLFSVATKLLSLGKDEGVSPSSSPTIVIFETEWYRVCHPR